MIEVSKEKNVSLRVFSLSEEAANLQASAGNGRKGRKLVFDVEIPAARGDRITIGRVRLTRGRIFEANCDQFTYQLDMSNGPGNGTMVAQHHPGITAAEVAAHYTNQGIPPHDVEDFDLGLTPGEFIVGDKPTTYRLSVGTVCNSPRRGQRNGFDLAGISLPSHVLFLGRHELKVPFSSVVTFADLGGSPGHDSNHAEGTLVIDVEVRRKKSNN